MINDNEGGRTHNEEAATGTAEGMARMERAAAEGQSASVVECQWMKSVTHCAAASAALSGSRCAVASEAPALETMKRGRAYMFVQGVSGGKRAFVGAANVGNSKLRTKMIVPVMSVVNL